MFAHERRARGKVRGEQVAGGHRVESLDTVESGVWTKAATRCWAAGGRGRWAGFEGLGRWGLQLGIAPSAVYLRRGG
jgi:hypothetical protein